MQTAHITVSRLNISAGRSKLWLFRFGDQLLNAPLHKRLHTISSGYFLSTVFCWRTWTEHTLSWAASRREITRLMFDESTQFVRGRMIKCRKNFHLRPPTRLVRKHQVPVQLLLATDRWKTTKKHSDLYECSNDVVPSTAMRRNQSIFLPTNFCIRQIERKPHSIDRICMSLLLPSSIL